MSTRTIAAVVILIGILIAVNYDKKEAVAPVPDGGVVACTMEAKQCPDGSYVGRTGPQCQFADCPIVTPPNPVQTATMKGVVATSPSCGVQADPPLPNCGPRPYQTTITFIGAGKTYTAASDATGKYSITLPVGSYKVQAKGGEVYPACPTEVVTLQSKQSLTKDITCDSGIL